MIRVEIKTFFHKRFYELMRITLQPSLLFRFSKSLRFTKSHIFITIYFYQPQAVV